jgi:hypothetical protein
VTDNVAPEDRVPFKFDCNACKAVGEITDYVWVEDEVSWVCPKCSNGWVSPDDQWFE